MNEHKPSDAVPAPAVPPKSRWQIAADGAISPKDPGDWMNGDLGQRATSTLNAFVDYYRYTGDPAAIASASPARTFFGPCGA